MNIISIITSFFLHIFYVLLPGYAPKPAIDYGVQFGPAAPTAAQAEILQGYAQGKALVRAREGASNAVYVDSLGYLTVGIGHKVTAYDGLRLGQVISDAQVNALFDIDLQTAFDAAVVQAQAAGIANAAAIAVFTSVNFQLGTGWMAEFRNTWADIVAKRYASAIARLRLSRWYKQTPVRANDLIAMLTAQEHDA